MMKRRTRHDALSTCGGREVGVEREWVVMGGDLGDVVLRGRHRGRSRLLPRRVSVERLHDLDAILHGGV